MHPQLAAVADEFAAATARATTLVETLDERQFQQRPGPARWSVAECLQHLNLTSVAYLPLLDAVFPGGRSAARDDSRRYRRDLTGWLLCLSLEPGRSRFKTTAKFEPVATRSRTETLAEFVRLQGELRRRLETASGMDLHRMRIASPFNGRISYNVYSGFRILAVHQRRHLWQADRVRDQTSAA